MAMNLKETCHHCGAKPGMLCGVGCKANGRFIRAIEIIVRRKLGCTMDSFKEATPYNIVKVRGSDDAGPEIRAKCREYKQRGPQGSECGLFVRGRFK